MHQLVYNVYRPHWYVGGRAGNGGSVGRGTRGGIGVGVGTSERKPVGSGYLAARHNPYWGHFLEKQGYCGVPRKKQKMDWRRRKHIPEYATMGKFPIVLTRLVTRSPIIKREGDGWQVVSPTVEKILVDICIDSMFEFLRHELDNIFEGIFDSFFVDSSILLSYAKRRGVEQRIKPYIEAHYRNHS